MPNRKKLRARRYKRREPSELDKFAWDFYGWTKYVAPDLIQSMINGLSYTRFDLRPDDLILFSTPISLAEVSERYETTEETK